MKTITEISKPKSTSANRAVGRLFFLEASGGRIHSVNPDGSDRKVILSGGRVPDGVVVDVEAGHIYWTNMGVPSKNDGSIERADLDGQNRVTIIGEGKTFTPKQLHLEKKSGKLYWCDREGMRVMRANTVNRASIDADFAKHPTPDILLTHLMEGIGIALDFKGNRMFITDLAGNIFSAKLDGSEKKPLLVAQGNLTGIAYAEIS